MSNGSLVASLTLKFNDQGSAAASHALQTYRRALKDTESASQSMAQTAISAFQKLADSREILGIRSEKQIQNEIRRTEAAYQRLAKSGTASAHELARASDAAKEKIKALKREMDGGANPKGGSSGFGNFAKALTIAAGYQTGKSILEGPIHQTMDYDRRLAQAANTAFAGKSLEERRKGMTAIDQVVAVAIRTGLGSRTGALDAYQNLAGSGEYKPSDISTLLPYIMRAATANGGSADEFSRIALAAKRNLGLTDFKRVANMATTAGQLGGFEIQDMAKGLPEQLAAAKNAGLSGYSGYASLLALNQAAVSTSGSTDTASNNVVNLLNKINSRDTAADFKKMGIDLDGSLMKAQEGGTNTLEAFGNLVDILVSKNSRYKELREKAKGAKGDEQVQIYDNMAQIAEGAGIGQVIQDRQALMAFLAFRNQREKYDQNKQSILNTGDSVGDNFALVWDTPSAQSERLSNEKEIAKQGAMDHANPILGGLADRVAGFMQQFPSLSAAASGITTAGQAVLGIGGAVSLGSLLFGKGSAAGTGSIVDSVITATKAGGTRISGSAGAFSVGALPLAGMAAVTDWAGNTSEDLKRIQLIQSMTDPLSSLLGDPTAKGRLRYEERRAELNPQPQTININIDGRVVAQVVNDYNRHESQRH